MDTKFQTSFIPKAPVVEGVRRRREGIGIFLLIAIIIFLASGVMAGGVFLYSKVVDSSIATGMAALKDDSNTANSALIKDYARLNDRINSAYTLLKQHVAVSNLLSILSAVTLKSVKFNNFTYQNSGNTKVSLTMSGNARKYESVALQAKALTDPTMKYPTTFKSPLFNNLNVDLLSNVSFNLVTGIDPHVLSYYGIIQDLNKSGDQNNFNSNSSQNNNINSTSNNTNMGTTVGSDNVMASSTDMTGGVNQQSDQMAPPIDTTGGDN
jgi:hypothetical protein